MAASEVVASWPTSKANNAVSTHCFQRHWMKCTPISSAFVLCQASHFPEASRSSMIGTDCPGLTT
jgi:hypothetical protein